MRTEKRRTNSQNCRPHHLNLNSKNMKIINIVTLTIVLGFIGAVCADDTVASNVAKEFRKSVASHLADDSIKEPKKETVEGKYWYQLPDRKKAVDHSWELKFVNESMSILEHGSVTGDEDMRNQLRSLQEIEAYLKTVSDSSKEKQSAK